MKLISRITLLLLAFLGCSKKHEFKQGGDFNVLMGANTSIWRFVITYEDFENLQIFRDLYEKNRVLKLSKQTENKIPKVIHFVWLGPNPFPKESIQNLNSWVERHPDWTFKFWTDRPRPLPNKKMKLCFISTFFFDFLKRCYDESDNYAEKSDLFRYELLYKEGGLYVDHDVKCFSSFAPFHSYYELYCGMEPPHETIISSSITASNSIIGSRPQHGVLKKVIETILSHWESLGAAYPGQDNESVVYRVAQRTFVPFDQALKEKGGEGGSKDIVFPAAYFNPIGEQSPLYAHHTYASTWFETETPTEKNIRRRLMLICKKNNQILLFNAVILALNFIFFGGLFFQYRAIRHFRYITFSQEKPSPNTPKQMKDKEKDTAQVVSSPVAVQRLN